MASRCRNLSAYNSAFNKTHNYIRPPISFNAANTRYGVTQDFTNVCYTILRRLKKDSLVNKGTMMGHMLYRLLTMGRQSQFYMEMKLLQLFKLQGFCV